MSGKTKLFVLKRGSNLDYKPVSWQLRTGALVYKENKGLRQIVYVEGGHSIWMDEYDKSIALRNKEIWFEDGSLLVNPTNLLLIEYLVNHPDFGVKYILDDPEADAILKLAEIEKYDQVKTELSKLEDFDALVESIRRKDEVTFHLSPSQKKLRCYEEAKSNPDLVLKALRNPNTATKYLVALALNKGIIKLNSTQTQVIWGDNEGVITSLAIGQKAIDIMAEFLFEPKNEGTLEELVRRVDLLAPKKPAKKK